MISADELPSTRPYLIRALYEWCSENGFTPYVAVKVDNSVQVPREYVQGGEIVLNVSMDATSSLKLGNDFIEFKARFGGKPRDIMVPISRVMAIYARENGAGTVFTLEEEEEYYRGYVHNMIRWRYKNGENNEKTNRYRSFRSWMDGPGPQSCCFANFFAVSRCRVQTRTRGLRRCRTESA
mgnify:CR=1 FL=1